MTRETYDPATYRSGRGKGRKGDSFSSNAPHRAPVLCYIAGVECPIVSVDVSYGVGNIPEARVVMFPDRNLQRLGAEDRVPVVLFFLDEYFDSNNPTWRMLFEGEIVGWGFTNTVNGRAIHFDCVMDIAIWTQLFLFYMTTISGIVQSATSKDPTEVSQAVGVYPFTLFHRGLMPENNLSPITRPYDFAYNVIRGLISNKVSAQYRCVPAVNFFTRWTRRQQFHQKWVALPYLDEMHDAGGNPLKEQPPGLFPILRAVQSQQAVDAIRQKYVNTHSKSSIFEMVKGVLDIVYMEIAMIPTPAAVTCDTLGNILSSPEIRTPSEVEALKLSRQYEAQKKAAADAQDALDAGVLTPDAAAAAASAKQDIKTPGVIDPKKPMRLTNYFIKPQFTFCLPPACNVIFPSMTPSIQYQESYATQPTRLYVQDQALTNIIAAGGVPDTKQIVTASLSRAYPPEADLKFQEQRNAPYLSGKNLLLWPEEFFKGPVTSRIPAPSWFMYYAIHNSGTGQSSGANPSIPDTESTVPPGQSAEEGLTDKSVYRLYAQYEFFRQRYAARQGAVTCAFHPYLIPGFPLAVFDDFHSRLHLIGYLMNVQQHLSAEGVTTSANFTHGRTIYEFFSDVAREIDDPVNPNAKGHAWAAAPAEPIQEIRDRMQHFSAADQFYRALLYRDAPTTGKPAVFQYRDLLSFVKSDGTLAPVSIEGRNSAQVRYDAKKMAAAIETLKELKNLSKAMEIAHGAGGGSSGRSQYEDAVNTVFGGPYGSSYQEIFEEAARGDSNFELILQTGEESLKRLQGPQTGANATTHNLTSVEELTPQPGAEPYFDSYDSAMKYVSRPICTLEQYITFIGGVRRGVNDNFNYKGVNVGARFYSVIRDLKGATDDDAKRITKEQQGLGATPAAVDKSFPDLRADWVKTLLAYRQNVYSSLGQR